MGIGLRLVQEPHLLEKRFRLGLILRRCTPLEQVWGNRDVFQYGILGEEVEALEHQPKVEPIFPALRITLGQQLLASDPDLPLVRGFQEVQAPQ